MYFDQIDGMQRKLTRQKSENYAICMKTNWSRLLRDRFAVVVVQWSLDDSKEEAITRKAYKPNYRFQKSVSLSRKHIETELYYSFYVLICWFRMPYATEKVLTKLKYVPFPFVWRFA